MTHPTHVFILYDVIRKWITSDSELHTFCHTPSALEKSWVSFIRGYKMYKVNVLLCNTQVLH